MGLATEDGMSAEERTKYNAYLRELIEAVGITLAKATAGALLWNSVPQDCYQGQQRLAAHGGGRGGQ